MSTGERIDVEERKDFVGFEELWGVFVSHMWDFLSFYFWIGMRRGGRGELENWDGTGGMRGGGEEKL